ncbi:MAG: YbjN domain-containing protein [Parachlamydiaceae bacterium]|nr:YbjN domain-containing protein [Parachlamydiaceae bacterium]
MNTASLNLLKELLVSKGYQCAGFDELNQNLEVIIDTDSHQRIWKVILCPTIQLLAEEKETNFLQIFLSFPYTFETKAIPDLSRLLLLLNKTLLFPAFGLSENEGIIYYRHTLYCENGVIPKALTRTIIGVLSLYIDSLSYMIEAVASGRQGVQEVLEDALKTDEAAA